MGRIKSTLIKRTAKKLIAEENLFSNNFDEDKKLLGNTMPSKRIRNKIAGYIARLKKMQQENVKQAAYT